MFNKIFSLLVLPLVATLNIGKKKGAVKAQPVTLKVETKKADMKKEEIKSQESNITIKTRTLSDETSMC